MTRVYKALAAIGCSLALMACGPRTFTAQDSRAAVFWDRQTNETAALLDGLIDEYNATAASLPIRVEHTGNYGDIYQKTIGGIRAGQLPAMAVAYESMVADYASFEAAADLRPLLDDPELGLTQQERDDFFPVIWEACFYPEHENRMLSFPFTKSVLVMYVNEIVQQEAGITEVPKTWDEFVDQCRRIKQETGKTPLAFDAVDASTISGFIFSMGGRVMTAGRYAFDSEPVRRVFELLETLRNEDLLYQIPPRTFNDQVAFGNNEIAFSFRPSSSIPYFEQVKEGRAGWRVAPIPQADPERPGTVLYGANLTIFNTSKEQQRSAWAFAKFFTSPDVLVRWCLGSGYVPFRRSAVDHPALQAQWNEWPDTRIPFDALEYAKTEPRVRGWQQVRSEIANASVSVVTGMHGADAAVLELQRKATALLD